MSVGTMGPPGMRGEAPEPRATQNSSIRSSRAEREGLYRGPQKMLPWQFMPREVVKGVVMRRRKRERGRESGRKVRIVVGWD